MEYRKISQDYGGEGMKTLVCIREGEPIRNDAVLVRTEVVEERFSTSELYDMNWLGIGPFPTRTVRLFWYEVPLAPEPRDEEEK